jgi:putative PIN family toxin of toxin-antitoxin system
VKIVADTMIWVSYFTRADGYRHRLIERACQQRVRIFVSEYILHELNDTLVEDLHRNSRFALLSSQNVLKMARLVRIPLPAARFVMADPKDDPIVQTAIKAKADYLVTADKEILKIQKIQDLLIISPAEFEKLL